MKFSRKWKRGGNVLTVPPIEPCAAIRALNGGAHVQTQVVDADAAAEVASSAVMVPEGDWNFPREP